MIRRLLLAAIAVFAFSTPAFAQKVTPPAACNLSGCTLTGSFIAPSITVRHPTSSSYQFFKADGSLAYIFGRSIGGDNAQNIYLYNPANGSFPFTVDSSDVVTALGSVAISRAVPPGAAPGANNGRLTFACGTNAGTMKLQAYAGTSNTPVTVVDNIGSGVTGC